MRMSFWRGKKIFETMTENFPNLMKTIKLQIQETALVAMRLPNALDGNSPSFFLSTRNTAVY